mgnify:CR=1
QLTEERKRYPSPGQRFFLQLNNRLQGCLSKMRMKGEPGASPGRSGHCERGANFHWATVL